MPLYEYKCKQCDAQFEVLQAVGATGDDLVCPECKTPKPEKIFSLFASGSTTSKSAASASCGTGGFS